MSIRCVNAQKCNKHGESFNFFGKIYCIFGEIMLYFKCVMCVISEYFMAFFILKGEKNSVQEHIPEPKLRGGRKKG